MSHHLPSSCCSRRQRYQVSLLLSRPPPRKKSTRTKQSCLDSGAVATQVPLVSRTGSLPHDLPFHFCIHRQQYQYGCPSLSPPSLPFSSLLASSVAWRSQLLSASSLCHLVMKHSAASTTPRYHFPPFLAAVGHSTVFYAKHQGDAFRGSLGGLKHLEVVY